MRYTSWRTSARATRAPPTPRIDTMRRCASGYGGRRRQQHGGHHANWRTSRHRGHLLDNAQWTGESFENPPGKRALRSSAMGENRFRDTISALELTTRVASLGPSRLVTHGANSGARTRVKCDLVLLQALRPRFSRADIRPAAAEARKMEDGSTPSPERPFSGRCRSLGRPLDDPCQESPEQTLQM